MQSPPPRAVHRFGDFEFDPRTAELRREGRKVALRDQPAQVLTLLLARPGELVTREEARRALWPQDTFVDFDVGLNTAVKRLRDALQDSADAPRFVETLPRRGYRFIAPVDAAPVDAAEAVPAPIPESAPEPAPAPAPRRRWPRAAAVALAVLVLALGVAAARRSPGPAPQAIASLAVLPFDNIGDDREQDFFAEGMTDALITSLAQIHSLRVISRTSVTQYRRGDKLLPQIARDLAVDAVVEGTVVRSGDTVRVTAQLIHARTDRHLWARTYERGARDVLALQSELAAAIADAIRVEVTPEERRRLTRTVAVDPAAYDAYLKGRFFWNRRTPQDLTKAAAYFREAIAIDPRYAPAHSGLSDTYRLHGAQGLRPRECMPRAEEAARRALALDDTLAEAHASLAGVLYRYHWDWEGAEVEFRRSLELDPGYAEGYRAYAVYLLTVRRHDEALAAARRARELSPLSPVINVELGTALARVGRYDEAIRQTHKALEIDPGYDRAYAALAGAHEGRGDRAAALEAFEKAASLSGRRGAWQGYLYALEGRREDALAVLAAFEERSRKRFVSPQQLAILHLGLGDDGRAFALLEEAYEERAFEILGFSGPLFERLQGDPRFQDLLRRMRYPAPR